MLNVGLVYDLIAKIWAETDPVYDLPAIDRNGTVLAEPRRPLLERLDGLEGR